MPRLIPTLALTLLAATLLAGCNRAEKEAREELAKLQATLPLRVNPHIQFTKAELVGKEIRLTMAMEAKLALQIEADKLQDLMREQTCKDAGLRKVNKSFATAYLVQADGATFHRIAVPKDICDLK